VLAGSGAVVLGLLRIDIGLGICGFRRFLRCGLPGWIGPVPAIVLAIPAVTVIPVSTIIPGSLGILGSLRVPGIG
jgi:hypothetical protein